MSFNDENEFYTPPQQPEEIGDTEPPAEPSVEPPVEPSVEPPVEENTTYHFSYKPPVEPAYTAPKQNAYYAPPQNNYYTPQDNYYTPPRQETEHATSVNGEPTVATDSPAPKKKSKTVTVLVSVFAACIIFAIVGLFISALSSENVAPAPEEEGTTNASQQVQIQQPNTPASSDTNGALTVKDISDKCINSCVGITVYTQQTSYNNFFGFGSGSQNSSEQIKSGEGSGILMLETNGITYVMTCAHVISDGTSFVVTLNDGTEYKASMVGYDAQTDIGVLAIKATGLQIAEFGDSDKASQGEQVVAIGCPGGLQFLNSITVGYISALGRPVSPIGYDMECIQVDAAINPGNSGGALFNMSGQVIGVTSSKIAATDYEGMGFAVPSNTAVNTANSLIKVGYVEGRAMIGITYKSISAYSNSEDILKALAQLGYENAAGTMVINTVREESDLAGKDVKPYDMIIAVNGETLTTTDIMTSALSDSKPGDTITLTVARIQNNQIDTFEVECKLIENKGN